VIKDYTDDSYTTTSCLTDLLTGSSHSQSTHHPPMPDNILINSIQVCLSRFRSWPKHSPKSTEWLFQTSPASPTSPPAPSATAASPWPNNYAIPNLGDVVVAFSTTEICNGSYITRTGAPTQLKAPGCWYPYKAGTYHGCVNSVPTRRALSVIEGALFINRDVC